MARILSRKMTGQRRRAAVHCTGRLMEIRRQGDALKLTIEDDGRGRSFTIVVDDIPEIAATINYGAARKRGRLSGNWRDA